MRTVALVTPIQQARPMSNPSSQEEDKSIFLSTQIHFLIETNTFFNSDKYILQLTQIHAKMDENYRSSDADTPSSHQVKSFRGEQKEDFPFLDKEYCNYDKQTLQFRQLNFAILTCIQQFRQIHALELIISFLKVCYRVCF